MRPEDVDDIANNADPDLAAPWTNNIDPILGAHWANSADPDLAARWANSADPYLAAPWANNADPGPEVIKLFSCSTQLSMNFFRLINVKMPTIVGIFTFMSGKNSILGLPEPKECSFSWYFYTFFIYIFILTSI